MFCYRSVLACWENTQYLLGCHSALAGEQTLKLGVKTVDTLKPKPDFWLFSKRSVRTLGQKARTRLTRRRTRGPNLAHGPGSTSVAGKTKSQLTLDYNNVESLQHGEGSQYMLGRVSNPES